MERQASCGMFPSLFGGGANKKKPVKIQRETVKIATEAVQEEKAPSLAPLKAASTKSRPLKRKILDHSARASVSRKGTSARRSHSSQPAVDFGQVDSESEDDLNYTPKKTRFDEENDIDKLRRLRNEDAFDLDQPLEVNMIHAANIPRLDKSTKFEPVFESLPSQFTLELQYPSALQRERFV